MNPGGQSYLAGTIGEIRGAHFHTGIDIKTGGEIGLPVYAVADGYISRIKVSTGGYGHTLYMAHPNGTFSVYAHLDSFEERLDASVREEQYEKESYEIELFPNRNQYFFKKGQLIGYSGNTGSSSGPHLHFEIRDKDQRPLDLLKFGFSEVRDRRAPVVDRIAFITLDADARINGLFGRYEFDVTKVDGVFTTTEGIQLEGRVGIEIYSYDPMDGIPNKNGVIRTIALVDGDTIFHENKHALTFSRQRNVLKHYNYEAFKRGSRKFNKLYRDDGNRHNIYLKTNPGVVFEKQKQIQIYMEDSHGNSSTAEIKINEGAFPSLPKTSFNLYEIWGNTMHLKSEGGIGIKLNEWKSLNPYYSDGITNYYLWDLDQGMPKRVFIDGETSDTDLIASIPSSEHTSYHQEEFEVTFKQRSLFDTLHLSFKKVEDTIRNRELFVFQNHQDPIRTNIQIRLKAEKTYDKEKSHVYSVFGKRTNFMGGDWTSNQITFDTRDLVTYTILTDSVAPTITPRKSNTIAFKIDDELSGIKSYRAELNGAFVLMRYEPKKDLLWLIPRDSNISLSGEFKLEVVDNANNNTIYKKSL